MGGQIGYTKRRVKVIRKDKLASPEIEREEITKIQFDEDLSSNMTDIVFCIDTTASMGPYINLTKNMMTNLVEHFRNISNKPLFAVVAYRDHPPQECTYLTKIHDLGPADEALQFLKELTPNGGGDECEAVLQGLWESLTKITWRTEQADEEEIENKEKAKPGLKRVLIHIGDAPAHGQEFHKGKSNDYWPKGCPSGISIGQLAEKMNELDVFYYICKLNTKTDVMADIFKANFRHYEPLDLVVEENDNQGEYEYIDEDEYERMKDKYEICDPLGKAFHEKVAGAIIGEMKAKKPTD